MVVIHDMQEHRFKIEDPKGLCYLEYSEDGNNQFTVLHTIVPDELSGRGLAAQLAQAFYDWIRSNNYSMKSDAPTWMHGSSAKRLKSDIQGFIFGFLFRTMSLKGIICFINSLNANGSSHILLKYIA